MLLGLVRASAPRPLTFSVVAPVFVPLPTLNRTPKPLVKVKPGGTVEATTNAFGDPVESAPENTNEPPCPGEIGVDNAVNDVMSALAPACAALVRQVTSAL